MSDIDQHKAAARLVARMVAVDARVDWREIEFLDQSGAFVLLGIDRREFMVHLVGSVRDHLRPRHSRIRRDDAAADIGAVQDRSLQLLVAALLVYVCEADRVITVQERALVERMFTEWDINTEILEQQVGVPRARTQAALTTITAAQTSTD